MFVDLSFLDNEMTQMDKILSYGLWYDGLLWKNTDSNMSEVY